MITSGQIAKVPQGSHSPLTFKRKFDRTTVEIVSKLKVSFQVKAIVRYKGSCSTHSCSAPKMEYSSYLHFHKMALNHFTSGYTYVYE